MITYEDIKKLRTLYKELTGRTICFNSVKGSESWEIFEQER